MLTPLLHDFLDSARAEGMIPDAVVEKRTVIVHLTPNASVLVRDGFLTGIDDFPTVLEAIEGVEPTASTSPGLSFGYTEDGMDEVVRRISAGSQDAAVVVAPAVRIGTRLVFDGYDLDPTRVIGISRKHGGFEVEGRLLDLEEAIRAATAAALLAEEDHADHRRAREETGFWGKAGAGCVVVARSTGRLLVGLRSMEVLEPGTWGTFGGAIDRGMSPDLMALKELRQETGFQGPVEMVPLYVFEASRGGFRYYNFAAVVDEEFEPELNWEHEAAKWSEIDRMPRSLHFGLKALLEDEESQVKLRALMPGATPAP